MTHDLILGDRTYSSWSLRAFLMVDRAGLDCRTRMLDFSEPRPLAEMMPEAAPARTVPVLITPEGVPVSESLAIAEELASRHPGAGIWPEDPDARARARTLAAEMHAGFGALRSFAPMNLRLAYAGVEVPQDVAADLARIEAIWQAALEAHSAEGPWLCGPYSAADAFYAPVAARIAGYGLPVGPAAAAYVARHLADPAFRRWRAMGLVRGAELARYDQPYAQVPWPGPAPRPARAVETGTPENAGCPYSGKPVTHLMEMEGRTFGFCNAFCRDKTVADPEAWPAFTALL